MKLIIWWLALMIILPLLYLFWWKKRWRLLLGIIILAVLAIGYLFPSEFTYSLLASETDKEKPLKKLEAALTNISDTEPSPSDPEKLKLEKLIIDSQKKMKNLLEKERRGEKLTGEEVRIYFESYSQLEKSRDKWIRSWGRKEKPPTFLFCGEHFNEELSREGTKWENKWQKEKVESYNIIDFGQKENNNHTMLKKKLQEICEKNEASLKQDFSPIVWLKNIDKITNSELKNELLKIVDPDKKSDLGEYRQEIKKDGKTENVKKTIDLSQFTLVATTSTTNPQLSKELLTKLKHVEPFFDKYFWTIFYSSTGMEIIIFFLLIRARRKEKKKTLKQFDY